MKAYEDLARLRVEEALQRGLESQRFRPGAAVTPLVELIRGTEAEEQVVTRRGEEKGNRLWELGKRMILALPRRLQAIK